MPVSIAASAALFIGVCIVSDVRTRRIPNVLTGPTIALGTALNGFYGGYQGVAHSALGLLLPVAVLLVPFALGGIGGGDVKMMGALGALVGAPLALGGLVAGMILGGVIMAVHLARLGRLGEKLRATGAMFWGAATTGSVASLRMTSGEAGAVSLPYSVPLGLASLAVLAAGACR
jgi:prepilin peptidase CpaA